MLLLLFTLNTCLIVTIILVKSIKNRSLPNYLKEDADVILITAFFWPLGLSLWVINKLSGR